MSRSLLISLGAALGLLTAVACSGGDAPEPDPGVATPPPVKPVVVYSGRGESLVGPLFEKLDADKALPFPVEVQYGDTAEMATRMATEGRESPADVFFAQDSGHLGALAARGMLGPIDEDHFRGVTKQFQDPDGKWIGTSGRLRVLVYDTKRLKPKDMPKKIEDLADKKWKGKLGWAPSNGSFLAHVSFLRHTWGEEKTREWLQGVMANNPTSYPKNSPQVAAVNSGELQIGWVNHYYLHQTSKENRRAANYSFSTPFDPGNVLMMSGVGVRQGTDNAKNAQELVGWLLSPEVQAWFATELYEYPVLDGVETHPDVMPLADVTLAQVDQRALSDVGATRDMLQELGLQ